MTKHEFTALAENPNRTKPAYKKDAIVILTADYTKSVGNSNLTIGAVCIIEKCGYFNYPLKI